MREYINLNLPEELSVFTVEEYRSKILEKISDKSVKSLDAAKLRLLDGAGIQLLLSLHKSFPGLKIENITAELSDDLELLGVKEILIEDGSGSNG